MKVGDLIRFKSTGVIGTITEIVGLYDGDHRGAAKVLVSGINMTGIENPTIFRTSHLEKVAEIISIS